MLTQLTDLCIKNGGDAFLAEIASPAFMDTLALRLRRAQVPEVRGKMLRCLSDWRMFAQTRPEEWSCIEHTAAKLEREGIVFPAPDPNTVAAARAFSETLTAPVWQDGAVCTKCRAEFSTFLRKHHCRNCGRVFCYQCSSKTMPLPWYGVGQDVRVCDGCNVRRKPYAGPSAPSAPPKPTRDPRQSAPTEDADLARAIALSLEEAQPPDTQRGPGASVAQEGRMAEGTDADDPDLAAAIAASLRDLPPEPAAAAGGIDRGAPWMPEPAPGAAPLPRAPSGPSAVPAPRPPLELAPRDVDNVLTFSQTVLQPHAPWKARVNTDGMPRPVQNMYEKATASRLRVVRNLDEGTRRLNQLGALHEKLSEVVRMYDALLDAQAGSTSLPSAPVPSAPMPRAPLPSAPSVPDAHDTPAGQPVREAAREAVHAASPAHTHAAPSAESREALLIDL